jgi:hypothetical protein
VKYSTIAQAKKQRLRLKLAELLTLHTAIPDPQFGDATLDESGLTLEAEFFRTAHAVVVELADWLEVEQTSTELASADVVQLERLVEQLQTQVTKLAEQLQGVRLG